jgi:hypothetical protein
MCNEGRDAAGSRPRKRPSQAGSSFPAVPPLGTRRTPGSVGLESTPRGVAWLGRNASPEGSETCRQNAGETGSPARPSVDVRGCSTAVAGGGAEPTAAAVQGAAQSKPNARTIAATASTPGRGIDLKVVGTCVIRVTP